MKKLALSTAALALILMSSCAGSPDASLGDETDLVTEAPETCVTTQSELPEAQSVPTEEEEPPESISISSASINLGDECLVDTSSLYFTLG